MDWMPAVGFYLRKSYAERKEDILIAANENRSEEQRFKDISDWERFTIRNYTNSFISVFRKWESDGRIIDPRQPNKQIEAKLKLSDSVAVNGKQTAARDFKRVLMLGEKQLDWLKKALAFYHSYEALLKRQPNLSPLPPSLEAQSDSVGELISGLIDDASWRLFASIDTKELEAEEKALVAEQKPAKVA